MSHPSLSSLLHRLHVLSPEDAAGRAALLAEVEQWLESTSAPRSELQESVRMLVSYLAQVEAVAGETLQGVVERLLYLVAEPGSGSDPGTDEPSADAATLRRLAEQELSSRDPQVELTDSLFDLERARSQDWARIREEQAADLRTINDVLLGEILVRQELVAKTDVEAALRTSCTGGRPLGEELVAGGLLSMEALETALVYQERCRQLVETFVEMPGVDEQRGSNLAAHHPEPQVTLGGEERTDADLKLVSDLVAARILQREGRLSTVDLDQALIEHRAAGKRLCALLVENGALGWDDLQYAWALQDTRVA